MTISRVSITENKEWYTPAALIQSVYHVFGGIPALDPCANNGSCVAASTRYTLQEGKDGLKESWNGFPTIYCNPPYGSDKDRGTTIADWLSKCASAAAEGSEVIALIPVAPNTRHWKDHVFPSCSRICFCKTSRFRFDGVDQKGAPMAIAVVYWGTKNTLQFDAIFASWGAIVAPIAP